MNIIYNLTKRNIKLFVRNRSAVFFSVFSVLIIIFLYAAFLAKIQVDGITSLVGDIEGIRWLVDTWIMAGILTVNSITVPLSIQSKMVEDVESGIFDDFFTAPIKRAYIILGYLVSSWVIGIIMCIVTFFIAEIYIVSSGGCILSFVSILKILGMIFVSVITLSSLTFFLVSFVKSNAALGTVNTLVGTLIGFLAGIYIPIGILSGGIEYIIKIFPASYSASIFRQLFMEDAINKVFENAPAEALINYKKEFGVVMEFNGYELTMWDMVLIMILVSILFYGLSVFKLSRYKKK